MANAIAVRQPTRPAHRGVEPGWAWPLTSGERAAALAAAVALGSPFVGLALTWLLGPQLHPSSWSLFYPAVVVSAWLGGWRGGLIAGAESTLLVAWWVLPPREPGLGVLVPAAALIGTGQAVALLQHRLGRARERLTGTLHAAESARQRLDTFVQLAPDGIFVADLEGRYTEVNEAGARMLGFAREELLGKTIRDLLPQEDLDRLARSRDVLLEGCSHVAEWTLRCKDGSFLPVEVSARILPDGRWMGLVRDVRERQRMELALHRSEDELRRAQAVAHVGSWRLDVRENELLWSEEAYRIFGVPPGRPMTYEGFLERVHPDDRQYVDLRWKAALRGEPYDIEHRLLIDGAVRWVREKADLAFDATGELIGGLGTTSDISEQKRVEAALRTAHETERRLRGELEELARAGAAVSEAVASLEGPDVATVLHMIALQARALTGAEYVAVGVGTDPDRSFQPWVTVGMPAETIAAMPRSPRPVGTLGAVARAGQTIRTADVRADDRFRGFPAGHPSMAAFLGVPVHYRGRPVGNLYVANPPGAPEFTAEQERRLHQLAARTGVAIETAALYGGETERRQWLQTVIEQMPEAVVLVDPAGRRTLQNRAADALLPGSSDPLALPLRTPTGGEVAAEQQPIRRALVDGVTMVRVEHLLVTPRGEVVPVLVSVTPIQDAGRVPGAIAVLQDVRDQKELERLREEWTSIVAHDLRQPVGTIRLAVDALSSLRDGRLGDRERGLHERIRASADRLARMVQDLLDASRLEARRLSISQRDLDLSALVRRTADGLAESLKDRPVELTVPEARAWADRDRVQQVLENLLTNADKYGRPGTPIRVEVVPRDDEVQVTVSNEGRGIPPDELPLLFTRFMRSREARAGPVEGLGLGLYISHGLVLAHGGRMWAESVPGQTTRLHFTLPRRPAPE